MYVCIHTAYMIQGERCSLAVQMWHYHLRGLHDDLWEVGRGGGGGGGGEVMIRILTDVIADSLVFLEKRYSRAQPSYGRVNQFQLVIHSTDSIIFYMCRTYDITVEIRALHW